MKLRYLIPIIGYFLISYDIPHTEDQRPYKPLQGDEALAVMTTVFIINLLYMLLFVLVWKFAI
jgi:hypothetical protein